MKEQFIIKYPVITEDQFQAISKKVEETLPK